MALLNPADAAFVSRMLDSVTLADSVVPLSYQSVCVELLGSCHSASDVLRTSHYILSALERDFLEELDTCGGKASHRPAPSAAAAALFGKRGNELIDVVEVSKNDWYAFEKIFLSGQSVFFEELLRKLGELLGVRDYLFEYRPSGPVVLRFPPPSAYVGALTVFGDGSDLKLQPTCGPSAPDEVRDLLEKNYRPLRLDVTPYEVHGRKEQHPYVGALHDLLHGLRLARVPAENRSDLVRFFDALQRTAVDVPRLGEISEVLLEGPFDDQFGNFSADVFYERLFRQVNSYLGGESTKAVRLFAGDFYARLREEFAGHPREKTVLNAFAREVYRKRGGGE